MGKKPAAAKAPIPLKLINRVMLATVVAANIAVFAAFVATSKLALPKLDGGLGMLSTIGPASLAAIVAGVLADQFSPLMKARIIYLRWANPLPGARAFSDLGPADARVDMEGLKAKHGEFATDAHAQNRAWFKLYKVHENKPGVLDANKQYLLYRDYAATALLFLVALPPLAALKVKPQSLVLAYAACLLVQFLLARGAAAQNGRRLVTNVLSEASHG